VKRVFLLSPANAGGERARMILNERAQFDVAVRLRTGEASVGDLFTFVSGLYFRGKMAYAAAFADPPQRTPAALVITPNRGLLPPETPITLDEFRAMAAVPIELSEPRYREPLVRDAELLNRHAGKDCSFVLLGSVATPKYVEPFLHAFGDRLLFPGDFVGRGDMSRGGLMLRCARAGTELEYTPVLGAARHGPRPPKLPKIKRT
jgi:hypothetical protein